MEESNVNQVKSEEMEAIKELGSMLTNEGKSNIYTLTIIGQVEGHQVLPETVKTTKYEHVLPQLAAIEDSDNVDGVLVLLNTVGGDVEAGLAIAEMLDSIPIFARRMKFRHGVGIVILCMAIGKTVGSLIYFWQGFFE